MALGKAIYEILKAVEGDTYPVAAPNNVTEPYLVYNIISVVPENAKNAPAIMDIVRVQVDILADTYEDAQTLAASVRTAMDRRHGTIRGNIIDNIVYDGQSDLSDLESEMFRVSQDYIVRLRYT